MPTVDEQREHDAQVLHKFGYAQELFREMGGFSNFAIAFSIISILTGVISLYGYGVSLIGAACFWTWPVVVIFQLFNAMAMGEIASSFPLAGGVYPWAKLLGNVYWGWFAGWISMIGWWACLVGADFGVASFVCGSGWFGLTTNTWWIVGICCALLIIQMFMNIYGITIVTFFNNLSVWLHIAGCVFLCAVMLTIGRAHPFSYINNTGSAGPFFSHGWWLAFVPAILMSAWTINGMDSCADVSEETTDPQRKVPWGMVLAVIMSAIVGAAVIIALDVALPPLAELTKAMATTPGAVYIIQKVMPGFMSMLMLAIIIVAMFSCGLASMTVLQRMMYALARDNIMPFSKQLRYVHPQYRTPYNATIWGTICSMALTVGVGLLPVITSVSTIGFNLSYLFVIAIAIAARVSGKWSEQGPWNLGKYGLFIFGGLGILYNAFVCVAVVLPPNLETLWVFLALMVVLAVIYICGVNKELGRQNGAAKAAMGSAGKLSA
jgi:amino acid transporter